MSTLLLVDIQNDFCEGGALPVKNASDIIDVANKLLESNLFEATIATKDWHPEDHISFYANHDNQKPFDTIVLSYGEQVLWPDHCVQWTGGAEFAPGLRTDLIDEIFPKGTNSDIDSYSAFFDAENNETGLHEWLQDEHLTRDELVVVGLATDFCVKHTVLDALEIGYHVVVISDGCKAVTDHDWAIQEMKDAGAEIMTSEEWLNS